MARGLSQEALADAAGLHRTHVSLIERHRRSVRLETLVRIACALKVEPAALIPARIGEFKKVKNQAKSSDRAELERLFPYIREYQALANKHGIGDIFQDNGGKLLQTILVLNMKVTGSREGNDCRDQNGHEYELKSVNILLTKSFSTHHHLNPVILKKYRSVNWYFSVYEGIELQAIYYMKASQLEPWFKKQERKWHLDGGKDINNPKIPVDFVRQHGRRVYGMK